MGTHSSLLLKYIFSFEKNERKMESLQWSHPAISWKGAKKLHKIKTTLNAGNIVNL